MNASTSYWISQRCLVLAWPSHLRVNASALVSSRRKKKKIFFLFIFLKSGTKRRDSFESRHTDLLSARIKVKLPRGAIQMSQAVSFRFWRINIISNIYRALHVVLSRKIILRNIVIELSPSPTIRCNFIADGKVNSYVLQARALEERHSAASQAGHLIMSVCLTMLLIW